MKLFSKHKQEPAAWADPELSEEIIASAVRAAQAEEEPVIFESPAHTEPPRHSGRLPLTHRTGMKVLAFMMVIVMAAVTVGSVAGAIFMIDQELYTTGEWAYKQRAFENLAEGDAYTLIHYLQDGGETGKQDAMRFLSDRNIASAEIQFSEDSPRGWVYDGGVAEGDLVFSATWYHMKHVESGETWHSYHNEYMDDVVQLGTVDITICLADEFTQQDPYFFADRLISAAYALRYAVYGIGVAAAILTILCFIFLLCASGCKQGLPDPQPGWGTGVPIDLLTLGAAVGGFLVVELAVEAQYSFGGNDVLQIILLCAASAAAAVMFLGWCMSFALRVKLGGWWKNSVCFYALRLCWRILRKVCRWTGNAFRFVGRGILTLVTSIPLVWKTAVILLGIAAVEFGVFVFSWGEIDVLVVFWLIKNLLLIPLVLLLALMLRRLEKGGEAIAAGDLGYQVDTRRMLPDFRRHGENLNRIGEGMTAAVEQRLKSERMKTELITNVSHDIKTPLTSIINYADLIEKEPCDNEKITEYAGVLHRQSERLKRLIDDLVEASKASTGNLEVLLAPCEVGVLLTQTAGEYEQRLQERQLTLVTRQPEQPIKILADGRRLWRVFDNLMNNICKYGQSGTRVYLTLEETDGQAVISFKNTSREALNLTAEELMERFVQGDTARKTEGNGLGLSIARSLTELQKGTLDLTVDGDLFKVVLRFPTI